jgi:hypothetical protein
LFVGFLVLRGFSRADFSISYSSQMFNFLSPLLSFENCIGD